MIYADTLLNYPDWKVPFTVHTDASDKQVGAVISQNNKPIDFFYRILSKPQRNYTTTEKKILSIVNFPKKFRGILFDNKINVYSDHNNLVYAETQSEYKRVMNWKIIIK